MVNFFVRTYGCTFNLAESDAIVEALKARGHVLSSEAKAEVIVLNTCSVKEATEQKILHDIKTIKKKLVVTGCLAETSANLVKKANPAASIIGAFAEPALPLALDSVAAGRRVELLGKQGFLRSAPVADGLFGRVAISRGCLSTCSFCHTKMARGELKSKPVVEVRLLVERLAAQGAREIDLTSQDCGCYGFDFGSNAAALLNALDEVEGRFFLRLGMGNPQHFRLFLSELLDSLALRKVFKFLHVPVQNGSDAVLHNMRRGHSVKDFQSIASAFRKRFPFGVLATDLIAGFPGETRDDFEATLSLVEKNGIDFVNVSKYSARPGTAAFGLKRLDNRVVKGRSEELSALAKACVLKKNESLVGEVFDVVFLEKRGGKVAGRTLDYRPVLGEGFKLGEVCSVQVTGFGQSHLVVERP